MKDTFMSGYETKKNSSNSEHHHFQKFHFAWEPVEVIFSGSLLANPWKSSNQSQLFCRIELLVPCHNKLIKPSQKKSPTLLGLMVSKTLSQEAVFIYPSRKSLASENSANLIFFFFLRIDLIQVAQYTIFHISRYQRILCFWYNSAN